MRARREPRELRAACAWRLQGRRSAFDAQIEEEHTRLDLPERGEGLLRRLSKADFVPARPNISSYISRKSALSSTTRTIATR